MRTCVGILLALGCGAALAGQPKCITDSHGKPIIDSSGRCVTADRGQPVTDSNGHRVKDSNGNVVHRSNPKSTGWTADTGSVTADSSKTSDGGPLKAKCKGWTADSGSVTADSSCTADGGKAPQAKLPKQTKPKSQK
jgi:hypothetical protein